MAIKKKRQLKTMATAFCITIIIIGFIIGMSCAGYNTDRTWRGEKTQVFLISKSEEDDILISSFSNELIISKETIDKVEEIKNEYFFLIPVKYRAVYHAGEFTAEVIKNGEDITENLIKKIKILVKKIAGIYFFCYNADKLCLNMLTCYNNDFSRFRYPLIIMRWYFVRL